MSPDLYRQAASLIVLRPMAGVSRFEFLLLHKPRKRDAWQLPQGGVEGSESISEAALRELKEEAGIDGHILGESKSVYQYDFPASFRRFRPDHICGQCIHYVFATVPADTQVTVDGVEVNDFRWIEEKDLPRYIKRKEYLVLVKELLEEAMAMCP